MSTYRNQRSEYAGYLYSSPYSCRKAKTYTECAVLFLHLLHNEESSDGQRRDATFRLQDLEYVVDQRSSSSFTCCSTPSTCCNALKEIVRVKRSLSHRAPEDTIDVGNISRKLLPSEVIKRRSKSARDMTIADTKGNTSPIGLGSTRSNKSDRTDAEHNGLSGALKKPSHQSLHTHQYTSSTENHCGEHIGRHSFAGLSASAETRSTGPGGLPQTSRTTPCTLISALSAPAPFPPVSCVPSLEFHPTDHAATLPFVFTQASAFHHPDLNSLSGPTWEVPLSESLMPQIQASTMLPQMSARKVFLNNACAPCLDNVYAPNENHSHPHSLMMNGWSDNAVSRTTAHRYLPPSYLPNSADARSSPCPDTTEHSLAGS